MTVFYGSDVADATLTAACDMASATGGTETSKTSTYPSGAGVYNEVHSQGTASDSGAASIPSTPTGKGWVASPGAGTFAAGNWSASVTISSAGWGGSAGTTDITIRFFKYSGGTYTSIGTINVGITTTVKTTYSFAATSMPSTTFGSSDLLYVDLWWHDNSVDTGTDNPVIYESTSATTGVANDMQITTASFVALNTMSGTESNTVSDLGGLRQWGIEALTVSDIAGMTQWGIDSNIVSDSLLATDNTAFIESNSGSDSLLSTESTVFIETNTGNDTGGNQQSGVESNTGSDSLIATNSTVFINANTCSDSTLTIASEIFIENNTISDSAFYIETTSFIESNTGTDSLASSANTTFIESQSGSDAGGASQSGVDSGTTSDALLTLNIPQFIESNQASDSMLIANTTSFIEQTTGSDSTLTIATTQFVDTTTASDTATFTELTALIDATTATDINSLQQSGIESLMGTDFLLAIENINLIEANSANDSGAAGLVEQNLGNINNMNGEEDLVASDVGGMTPSGVESLIAIDSLLMSNTAIFIDSNSSSDIGGMQQSGTEASTASDTLLTIATTLPIENNPASDTASYTTNTIFTDNNTISDSAIFTGLTALIDTTTANDVGGTSQSGIDIVVMTDQAIYTISPIQTNTSIANDVGGTSQSGIDVALSSDSLLAMSTASQIEANSANDSLLQTGGFSGVESLALSEIGPGLISWTIETLIISDSGIFVALVGLLEANQISDSGTLMQQSTLPTFFIPFSALLPDTNFDALLP
jgi:hypothetical protein